MTYPIRLATSADVPAIVEVVNVASAIQESFLPGPRTFEAQVIEMMDRGVFFLSQDDEHVLASVFVNIIETQGYFGMLAVHPTSQRLGIGRQMVETAETYCKNKGCTSMEL